MSEKLDLYHRTSEDSARAILATRRFRTRENTAEAYVSNRASSDAADGYGNAVVHVRIAADQAELEDEFPDGELHYRIPLGQAEIVDAFTLDPNGHRSSLTGSVASTQAASFPDPAGAPAGPAAAPAVSRRVPRASTGSETTNDR